MPRAITMTRRLAYALGVDAANRQMRKDGRKTWSAEEGDLAALEFARLWPLEAEYPWMNQEQADALRAQGVS